MTNCNLLFNPVLRVITRARRALSSDCRHELPDSVTGVLTLAGVS